jgi:hypothetical protein
MPTPIWGALRAVTSIDGMTADFYPFGASFLGRVATRMINEVRGIGRITYDVTSKPPGTHAWPDTSSVLPCFGRQSGPFSGALR